MLSPPPPSLTSSQTIFWRTAFLPPPVKFSPKQAFQTSCGVLVSTPVTLRPFLPLYGLAKSGRLYTDRGTTPFSTTAAGTICIYTVTFTSICSQRYLDDIFKICHPFKASLTRPSRLLLHLRPLQITPQPSSNIASSRHTALITAAALPIYLAEHGPCVFGGDAMVDDASFATRLHIQSSLDTSSPKPSSLQLPGMGCKFLAQLESTTIMLPPPVLGGGFSASAPLKTTTSVCPSVEYLPEEYHSTLHNVWVYVVSSTTMQH